MASMTDSPMTEGSPNRAARRSLARRGGALGAGGVLVAGSAAALLTALAGSAGAAASIIVDSSADGAADATHCTDGVFNNCTLRDAAALAVDGDTITFFPSVTNITLTNGFVGLRAVNVAGPGSASLAITTTADAGSYNIFTFTGTGDATISGLTLTKNRIEARNDGNFTIDGVTVSGSEGALGGTSDSAYGGALYAANSGNLVISGSHFEENYAGFQRLGGAVFSNNPGLVAINDSEFINNAVLGYGGGIFVSRNAASFSLTNSVVTGNSASRGGGLEVRTYGTVTIADSDISSNTATSEGSGGAYFNGGSLAADVLISGSTFDGNSASRRAGGGLVVQNRSLVVNDSTISNNASGAYGGGIAVFGSERVVIINNSTIAGNQGVVGGIYASGPDVVINQSTISSNVGTQNSGGVLLYGGSLQVSGTIISGNSSATAGIEDVKSLYNASISSDHSLLGTVYGTTVTDDGGTIYSTSPGLLALADNGGLTKTMALDPTSVAIDAGPDPVASFTGNGFDQRGTGFDRVSNGTVDIGAFEVQADPPPTSSSTTSTTAPPNSTTTVVSDPTTAVATDPMVPEFTG